MTATQAGRPSQDVNVSVIVMTKNEFRNVGKCLACLTRFTQVFVVDSSSTDGTQEVATNLGAEVVQFAWNGGYPKKKQWSLEHLNFSNEWVLYVDADEEVPDSLVDEIARVSTSIDARAGYFVEFNYAFAGKVLRHGARATKLVLFQRAHGRFIDFEDLHVASMWEVEGHYQPEIDGRVGWLRTRMIHDDHDSLFSFFERHNRYSDWEAELAVSGNLVSQRESQIGSRRIMKSIFHAVPAKGFVYFIYSFVLKGGFLDGRAGFEFALAKAFYYWQVGIKTRMLRLRVISLGKSQ